jgi:uncharacterized protein YbaP (TraB family)
MGGIGRSLLTRALIGLLAVAAAPCVAEQADTGRSFLWRVQSETTTLHLLGSIHLMKPEDYPLSPSIEDAFDESQIVVFEVDLSRLTEASLQLLAKGTLPEGQQLSDVLSPETYDQVAKRVEEMGMDVAGFEKMRPWLLAVTLTSFELMRAGYTQASGVDMYFFDRAVSEGKETVGLETVEFQVGLFAELGAGEDEEFLRYTLQELDTVIPLVDELLANWRLGRVDEVGRLLTEAYQEYPELFVKLVSDRNLSWLPRLEELLAGDQDAMAVVGCLHLVGEKGLVELLRSRGYSVEQL